MECVRFVLTMMANSLEQHQILTPNSKLKIYGSLACRSLVPQGTNSTRDHRPEAGVGWLGNTQIANASSASPWIIWYLCALRIWEILCLIWTVVQFRADLVWVCAQLPLTMNTLLALLRTLRFAMNYNIVIIPHILWSSQESNPLTD